MVRRSPSPPIFHIVTAREADVRAIVEEELLDYAVGEVPGRPGIVEFRFRPMDDGKLLDLIGKIPEDAFAYRAVVGPPPPEE